MDRMIRSIDAALVVLNILTSPHMPKPVYLEEVMDRIIRLIKFQLQNTIFPEYDPIYKVESDSKGNFHIFCETNTCFDTWLLNYIQDGGMYIYTTHVLYILYPF